MLRNLYEEQAVLRTCITLLGMSQKNFSCILKEMCYITNIMLKDYYEQLLEVIQGDIELMLSEPDMTKRSPKIILSYLDMAKQCQESLDSISETNSAGWNSLTFDQQQRINAILSETSDE